MTSILDGYGSSMANSLLSAAQGRNSGWRGGLSWRARQLNDSFLSQSQQGFEQIFTLGAGSAFSSQAAKIQILGLRAGISKNALSSGLQQAAIDAAAALNAPSTSVAPSTTLGTNINKTA